MILSLLLALPLLQEAQSQPRDELPTLSVADLVLESYRPTHVDPASLHKAVLGTLGRSFYVRERGGRAGRVVTNTSRVGDVILVFDEPAYAKSILALCAKIDQTPAPPPPAPDRASLSWRLRSISLDRATHVVRTVSRRVDVEIDRTGGRILARGPEEDLAELKSLLEAVDVPDPRVMVTCYLLEGAVGGDSAVSPLLPSDLVDDLDKLLPQFSFRAAGFAMLQSSVPVGRELRLLITDDGQHGYRLEFAVAAYDVETGNLTAEGCRLLTRESEGSVEVFNTDTVLRSGEYTVLGATGAEPLLLVVRLEKL